MSQTSNLARKVKNKHVRHKIHDRGRISNNLTQRIRTDFLYKGYHAYMMNWNPTLR